ncbi:MAG TPA: hypothetical protein VM934_00005, partial [Pyrinomonadaceae bacterium]|nr:hypothetical protein [Pyrinomonadaceae bacterium]
MVFYEHSATPVYPLLVDTSLYNTGATLTEVSLSGTLANISPPTLVEEVVWQNVVGATASGNSVTATTEGWTAGASSSQSITSGDAAVEFTAAETNTHRMCGLSSGDANQHYTDIDYAIYLTNAGTILVYEGGRYIGEYGGYAAGDRFGVSIEGNTVKYSKNSRVFHAHTAGVQYPLVADTSFGNAGATIANAVLRRGGAGGGTGGSTTSRANIEWLVTDQLGTPRMVIAESGSLSSVKRHDYLPFGEEIGEGVGGRTTNQGYGQPDGVRNRFTGKERDAETGLDYFMARYLSSS